MFIVIPSVVKLDAELPLSAQMLYGIITWKCNKGACTWATNRELGEDLGVSAKRVSALLALLEERGHIETEIEYKDGTKEILRRYIYPIMKSTRGIPGHTPPPENGDTPSPGARIPPPENAEVICNKKRNKKDLSPYSPPAGDSAPAEAVTEDKPVSKPNGARREKSAPAHDPEAFEAFWAKYPRKDGRKAAIRAWDKLKPDKALCRTMYAALSRQRRSEQWAEEGGRFIPHFSTWLNGRKWEDQGVGLSLLTTPTDTSTGWADDPEVSQ